MYMCIWPFWEILKASKMGTAFFERVTKLNVDKRQCLGGGEGSACTCFGKI